MRRYIELKFLSVTSTYHILACWIYPALKSFSFCKDSAIKIHYLSIAKEGCENVMSEIDSGRNYISNLDDGNYTSSIETDINNPGPLFGWFENKEIYEKQTEYGMLDENTLVVMIKKVTKYECDKLYFFKNRFTQFLVCKKEEISITRDGCKECPCDS